MSNTAIKKDLRMNDIGQEQYNILRKSDAVSQRCSIKEMLLKISQNSGENTCG